MSRERGFQVTAAIAITVSLILISLNFSDSHVAAYIGSFKLSNSFFAQSAMSRGDIIARAKAWVDVPVPYDEGSLYQGYREDCSGFVSMAWQLSKSLTTYTLPTVSHQINKDDLLPGDILLNQWGGWKTSGSPDAHVVIFDSWVDSSHSHYNAYEESPYYGKANYTTKMPYPYWPGYDSSDYIPMRLNSLPNSPTQLPSSATTPSIPVPAPTPTPSLSQLNVYVSSQDGNIYGLNASNGKQRWKYSTGSQGINQLHVSDGVVYFIIDEDINTNPNATSTMYLLNAQDGTLIHRYKLPYFTLETGAFIPSFTVVNGTIFFSSPQMAFAMNSNDGTTLWQYSWSGRGASDPIVVNNVVYYVTGVGIIYAFQSTDGKLLWRYDLGPDATAPGSIMGTYPTPVIINNTFYVVGWLTDNVYAISLQTHTLQWHIHITGGRAGTLYATNGVLYVNTTAYSSETSTLYALRLDNGKQLWNKPNLSLQLANADTLYSLGVDANGSFTNDLYSLHAPDGTTTWHFPLGGNGYHLANIAVVYTTVYVLTDTTLYALQANDGSVLWQTPIQGYSIGS